MKIIISESRSIKIMKSYIDRFFPTLSEPLRKKEQDFLNSYFVGGKYKNSVHTETLYFDRYRHYFIKENANLKTISYRFYVTSELEPLYQMFGEELFEEYFRQEHNIDLSNPNGFDTNWSFEEFN